MIASAQERTLPHSEESERAVLAAVLLDAQRHLPATSARLQVEDFYFERHQTIFESMVELQAGGADVDLRTLQAKLEQKDGLEAVGGLAYLATLDVDLPDLSRVESYIEIIKERALRRNLINACAEIYASSFDGGMEAGEALDSAEQAIMALGQDVSAKGFVHLQDIYRDAVVDLEERGDQSGIVGLRTGFVDFDDMTQGLQPGNLVILAGRPGMGKTSLALNMAQFVAHHEHKAVGVFSLEMSQREIAMRVLCSSADIPFPRVRSGKLSRREWERVHQCVRNAADAPLFIDDSANPSLLEVASKARRLRLEKGLELLVVDYLQLMQAGGRYENRNLEIGAITRGLKQLAKELEIPVLCLSQLSRQTERRTGDHRPQLADLRESGNIEQDADIVLFIYRGEVYSPDDVELQGLAELIVAKHRNGETGHIDLAFFGETTTFRNYDRHAQPPPG